MGLIDEIRKIIEDYFQHTTFTSANPTHTNHVMDIAYSYEPDDLDASFKKDEGPLEPSQPDPLGGLDLGIGAGFGLGSINKGVGAAKNPLGALSGLARMIPVVAAVLALPATIKIITDLLRSPGGPFDIRFKRDIQEEIFQSVERDQKAKIRQGLTIVRVSSTPTLRGEVGIGQTGQVGQTGIARYDQDFETYKKLGDGL